MKRLLLFAILFGGGLFLLMHLAQKQREAKMARVDSEQELIGKDQQEEQLPFTRIPEPREQEVLTEAEGPSTGTSDESIQGTVRGEIKFSILEEEEPRNRLYHVDLEDVNPRGDDYYDVTNLTIEAFDRTTEELRTTFAAVGALLRLETEGTKLAVGKSEMIQLTTVTVTLHQGSPMAPLTLTLPTAQLDLESGSLFSDDFVTVTGEGVTGSGKGLKLLERGKSLEILHDGVLTLKTDGTTDIKLIASAQSSILMKRAVVRQDLERIAIRLSKGGELVSEGEPFFTFLARTWPSMAGCSSSTKRRPRARRAIECFARSTPSWSATWTCAMASTTRPAAWRRSSSMPSEAFVACAWRTSPWRTA